MIILLLLPLLSIFWGYKVLSYKLPLGFEHLIKYQKLFLRLIIISISVLATILFTIWMTWEFAHEDVLKDLDPVIIIVSSIILIESLLIFIQSLRITAAFKKNKQVSIDFKQKLEELYILKEKGIITNEEFDREKEKIFSKT